MKKDSDKSVLIVDDDKASIITLTHILSPEYTIYAAKNGHDGIELSNKFLPDVILLDINMPDMGGYEVLSQLSRSEKSRNIPVIFITALNSEGDEERGLALGAADYITKPFSPAVVKLRIGNQIKMIDQLQMIDQLSMIDQLTGIPNRQIFETRLNMEWGRALRERTSISILIMDVDNFQNYNDTYGYQQGDAALKSIAKTFDEIPKRHGDFTARWGYEEFAVLLPNTDSIGAFGVGEQLRKHIEIKEIFTSDGSAAHLTVSIGANTRTRENNCTLDEFVSEADAALRIAKTKGRNRVCHPNIFYVP